MKPTSSPSWSPCWQRIACRRFGAVCRVAGRRLSTSPPPPLSAEKLPSGGGMWRSPFGVLPEGHRDGVREGGGETQGGGGVPAPAAPNNPLHPRLSPAQHTYPGAG